MSMFSGLTNQISAFVANKTGGQANADPNADQAMDPNYVANGAEAELGADGTEQQPPQAGGMAGMAQGFLAKAMAAKEGVKEKASAFHPPNLSNLGGGMISNITSMIPGQRREEEVPTPPEPNPPTDMGGEMVEQYDDQQQYVQQ